MVVTRIGDVDERATAMILSLAAGEVSEEGLARWIRDNWPVMPVT